MARTCGRIEVTAGVGAAKAGSVTRGTRFSDFCNLKKLVGVRQVPSPVHAGEVPLAELSGLARILRLSGEPNVRAVLCAETDQFVERKMAKLHRSGWSVFWAGFCLLRL
jgi:hypothetical protein